MNLKKPVPKNDEKTRKVKGTYTFNKSEVNIM